MDQEKILAAVKQKLPIILGVIIALSIIGFLFNKSAEHKTIVQHENPVRNERVNQESNRKTNNEVHTQKDNRKTNNKVPEQKDNRKSKYESRIDMYLKFLKHLDRTDPESIIDYFYSYLNYSWCSQADKSLQKLEDMNIPEIGELFESNSRVRAAGLSIFNRDRQRNANKKAEHIWSDMRTRESASKLYTEVFVHQSTWLNNNDIIFSDMQLFLLKKKGNTYVISDIFSEEKARLRWGLNNLTELKKSGLLTKDELAAF